MGMAVLSFYLLFHNYTSDTFNSELETNKKKHFSKSL